MEENKGLKLKKVHMKEKTVNEIKKGAGDKMVL